MPRLYRFNLNALLRALLLILLPPVRAGELAYFTTPQSTPNVSHRQDVCDRYVRFVQGEVDLREALQGMQLRPILGVYVGGYFNYDDETGIDKNDPGLAAVLLDELARRGQFTWRDSFAIYKEPTNSSWTELLEWSVETYDINVDWWSRNLERMNNGVAFVKPWYDSSIILIKREIPATISKEINWWNWLRPYEADVWYLSLATILLSGLVFQWLEMLSGERGDRTRWEWFQENFYLSAINFTQAYEYRPATLAGRTFGISMTVWALVMTATYTANLASLLVDRQAAPYEVETVAEAAIFGTPICTLEGYYGNTYVAEEYPAVNRIPLGDVSELYSALRRGDCDFAVETVTSWETLKGMKEYNPTCDLARVKEDAKVKEAAAGFVTRADSGTLCSGLIRDVMEVLMEELIDDQFLDWAWEQEHRKSMDIDCAVYRSELDGLGKEEEQLGDPSAPLGLPGARRKLVKKNESNALQNHRHHRRMKASSKGAAGGAVASLEGDEASMLTLEQMLGTFAFHWLMMAIALVIAHINYFHDRYVKRRALEALDRSRESFGTISKAMKVRLGLRRSSGKTDNAATEFKSHQDFARHYSSRRLEDPTYGDISERKLTREKGGSRYTQATVPTEFDCEGSDRSTSVMKELYEEIAASRKQHREEIAEMRKAHREEMESMKTSQQALLSTQVAMNKSLVAMDSTQSRILQALESFPSTTKAATQKQKVNTK